MSESDDTDYLLSIPHNYFVINENDIDWNKQHTTFIDEVNKFLFHLNQSETTPTNTDTETNAHNNQNDKESVPGNSENNLQEINFFEDLDESMETNVPSPQDQEIERLKYTNENITKENNDLQARLKFMENNELRLKMDNIEIKNNLQVLTEELENMKNQISNTNNDAKYIKYENERLDLINKIQYSETKINNLTEEKNSFISKKNLYKEEISSLKLKISKIKNIYQRQLDQALHIKKREFENEVLQIKKFFEGKIDLKNQEIQSISEKMKAICEEYNYNFNIVKNERVDKIHLEEKIQQLTTIIKHQINKNKKMDNLIKLFKNHQQKCPFYLEELIHIDPVSLENDDIIHHRLTPHSEEKIDLNSDILLSYIKQLLNMKPCLEQVLDKSSKHRKHIDLSRKTPECTKHFQESEKKPKESTLKNSSENSCLIGQRSSHRTQSRGTEHEKNFKPPWK